MVPNFFSNFFTILDRAYDVSNWWQQVCLLTSVAEPGGDGESVPDLGHGVRQPVHLHAQLGVPQQSLAVERARQGVAARARRHRARGAQPPTTHGARRRLHGLGVGGVVQRRARVAREVAGAEAGTVTSVVVGHGVGLPGAGRGEHRLPVGVRLWVRGAGGWARRRAAPRPRPAVACNTGH